MSIDPARMKHPDAAQVAAYYDGHAAKVQRRVGVNQRHRGILQRLERSGLRPYHRVLEIGCGIGTLTTLLSKALPKGHVHAADISPSAITMARSSLSHTKNVEFMVSDMSEMSWARMYDRIVLPDVLEHIPEEQHQQLFGLLAAHLVPEGRVCINIPDPEALDHLRRTDPGQLQIIDQSLAILPMAQRFAQHGLVLDHYGPYRIWANEPDYVWIEFRRPDPQAQRKPMPFLRRAMRELLSRLS